MDLLNIAVWWSLFFVLGLINLPATLLLFKNHFDKGYGLSKILSLLFVSYTLFLGTISKTVPFTIISTYGVVLLLFIINSFIFIKNKNKIVEYFKSSYKIFVFQEILFIAGLTLWSTIKTFNPEIRSLEKLMDFGFINAMLKSKWLPAEDIWFAGKGINYYYFGQFFTAVATRLSFLKSSIAYNLMIATILGFLVNGAFSLISTIFSGLPKVVRGKAISAGIISLLLVTFAGNFHTPIYAFKEGLDKYWYPDATRFIGYNPETNDKTIHEFPLYSFVVSDLHAHLLNVPVVILYLNFLFLLFSLPDKTSIKEKFKHLIIPGFLLGIMFMTNTWDFGSYMIATGIILLLSKIHLLRSIKNLPQLFYDLGLSIIILFVIGILTALPFLLNFESIAQGIKFVTTHSPLWQLIILWGLPVLLLILFSSFLFINKKVHKNDLFILGLLLTSIVLIIIPEIIYIKDIYIASHYRANTMFKITYQAFVMSYLTGGYVALRIIGNIKNIAGKVLTTTFFTLLFSVLLSYPFFAVNSYYDKLKNKSSLDGELWINKEYPNTYSAIKYLRKATTTQEVILEAPGNSYTDYNIISSYTGLPTVQGWFVHEWLWRGSAELPSQRNSDADIVYTSNDIVSIKEVISKYKIKYIIVGHFEREKYSDINDEYIIKIAKKVFSEGDTSIYLVNP